MKLLGAPLTSHQLEVRDFIQTFNDEHGFSPTMREIATHFEVDLGSIFQRIHSLERHGAIELVRIPPKRTIRRIKVLPWSQT
jgi:DNA-binding MarR family transcriptional regulator